MTFTITVLPVTPVVLNTAPKNFEIRSAYFFTYQLEKRIFLDNQNQLPVTIWASLPGHHYTDPKLPSWLHFDAPNLMFSGQPPASTTEYNITLDIVGVDKFGNVANTTFTIEVFANTACTPKNSQINVTCTVGTYCSFTVQPDYFTEKENEALVYSLTKISNSSWP